MTLALDFPPEAQAEFAADVDLSDAREAGVDDPAAWATWPGWEREPVVRSKGVTGLPYRVVYFVEHDVLTIVAVAHAKRRPGYWRDRASL